MKYLTNKVVSAAVVMGLTLPMTALAADQDIQQRIDALTKEVEALKQQTKKTEEKSLGKWLTIGGDYRFRLDSLRGKTVGYSDAVGTMMNLVGGFTGPTGVAGQTIGGLTSPSTTQFMMMGKSGSLFTPNQFDTILTQYMPQAIHAAFGTPTTGIAGQVFSATGAGTLDQMIAQTALTAQQQAILSTLSARVLPTVMGMTADSSLAAAVGLPAGSTMQEVFARMSPAQQQLAMQMLMQGFLGGAGTNLATVPAYKPKNDTLYTNRLGIDLHAKATKDVTVTARLVAYKTFGSQTDAAVTNAGSTPFFADRVGVFDGTLGHIPSTGFLEIDRAYATWSNIAEQPVWFSVGRRPSTNGAPSNLRLNNERPGSGGTPALLVDYAFDGMTLGWAPDIEALPGAYAKICYGRGFDSGFETPSNSLNDTDMLGVAVVPVDTDPLRIWLQWNRGFNIFDFPNMKNTFFGDTAPAVQLGDIDWFGAGYMSSLKRTGPGTLNFFTDFGLSRTHPNDNVSNNAGFQGLMTGQFFAQEAPTDKTGWAVYAGARYDFAPTRTKIGAEYNHGSKNWITFAPAADDMWTSKLGTRGNVYEGYLIQELNLKPVSSYLSKVFFRLGYQYYDFEYTGSNNWVGAPVKIADLQATDLQLLTPLKSAQNIYGTFEVKF